MFYTFSQNNSGGSFVGPLYVVIEANSAEEANRLAEEKAGVYFNGCSDGRDCSCCGDRWSPRWSDDCGTEQPESYGRTDMSKWSRIYPGYVEIHKLDGTVEKVQI